MGAGSPVSRLVSGPKALVATGEPSRLGRGGSGAPVERAGAVQEHRGGRVTSRAPGPPSVRHAGLKEEAEGQFCGGGVPGGGPGDSIAN